MIESKVAALLFMSDCMGVSPLNGTDHKQSTNRKENIRRNVRAMKAIGQNTWQR